MLCFVVQNIPQENEPLIYIQYIEQERISITSQLSQCYLFNSWQDADNIVQKLGRDKFVSRPVELKFV